MQHNAGFTRDDVVTAALEIGVDRFTMGKVARRLGVSTADLGRTVSSRDDLLVACLERVSADATLPPTGLSWQDYLRRLSDSLWDVLDAHPGLDHTLINLAWAYVPFMSVAKRAHNALVSGGLRSEDAYLALNYTLSTVLTSHQQAAAMAETIELLRQEAPWCKVVVGGAVLTPEYARMVGADFYAKDATETARIAEEVLGT